MRLLLNYFAYVNKLSVIDLHFQNKRLPYKETRGLLLNESHTHVQQAMALNAQAENKNKLKILHPKSHPSLENPYVKTEIFFYCC